MLSSYRAELTKLARRPAVGIVLAAWLVLMLTFLYLFGYLSYRSASNARAAQNLLSGLLPQSLPAHALGGYPLWGGALIVVLGALCAGSEYGWGTVKTMLGNRPPRLMFYGAQLAAVGTVLAALAVVGFLLAGLASTAIAISAGASLTAPAAGPLLQSMAAGWLILWMWCLFGVALAVVVRGTALSIGLGLVWVLAVETVVRALAPEIGVLQTIEKGLPGTAAGSLAAALGASGLGVASAFGGQGALIAVLLFVALFAGLGGVLLRRRDIA